MTLNPRSPPDPAGSTPKMTAEHVIEHARDGDSALEFAADLGLRQTTAARCGFANIG